MIIHRLIQPHLWLALSLGIACKGTESSPPASEAETSSPVASQVDVAKGLVRIAPEAVARVGIRMAKVEEQTTEAGIDVPAEVQVEPNRQAHVASVVPGQISRVTASVGDHVQTGQALAIIRSVALGEARAQAARAAANMEVASATFRRQEELHREGIGAERQFLEAQAELRRAEAEQSAAKRALEVYGHGGQGSEVPIKSPIDGRVIERHATVGEVIAPSDTLFTIMDTSRVWVVGRVYQQNASSVREGASASLTLQEQPDRHYVGQIDYVAPSLDSHTRTLPVRMVLDNPGGTLRPGSFGTLSIAPAGAQQRTLPAVETTALQRLGDDTVVFVATDEPNAFRAVKVQVIARRALQSTVQGPINPGESYVADGGFVLKSELNRDALAASEGQ